MEPGEFINDEFNGKVDVMNILSYFIGHGKEQYGQADDGKSNVMAFTPSDYKTQLLMSTENRLETLATIKSQFFYPSELKVIPEIVIFQQFLPKKKYNTTITIINTDTESHFVKIMPTSDPAFLIEFKGQILNTRVAPGMSHVYNVQFSPDEARDYNYQLDVSTDLGLFPVPIIALGPRPILDFPDIITLLPTAVKIPSSTSLTIHNLGDAPAIFKLSSSNPQFSIKPSNGRVNPHQALQFTLNFASPSIGNFTGSIFLKYETGELIRIRTQGATTNCKINLSTKDLKMEDTFLGLSTDKIIKILNDSDYTLEYQWMRFQSLQEDNEEKQKFSEIFTTLKDTETLRYTNLQYFDICDAEIHEKTCERILQDEISSLSTENFNFSSKNFILSPTKGKIWPKSSSQILVTFQPQKMGEISITAFLEVSGSELRLPLYISGICRGPEIKLNSSTIEIEKIYLCSTQNIEIICSNVGFIPGTLVHREKPPDFGGVIRVSPKSHELNPNDYKSFNLSFMPSRTGEFVERVDFIIDESSEVISVYIKGLSICPSLHFDKSSIDLGPTGVGFTSTEEVTLQNRSTVPVKFKILIPDDVEKVPIMFNPFRLSNSSSNGSPLNSNSNSRDFKITPNQGVLVAQSSTKITVAFTPNVARGKRQNNLRVEVEGSDGVLQVLPIFYQSELPVFEIKPSGINLGACLINFPYTISFSIINDSDVEGLCYFPRQSCSERSGMFYSLSRSQWHLKPRETKKASITLITRSIGQQPMELCLMTLGGKSEKYFPIICEGQGPVISVQPSQLDFGDVKVLETMSKSLKITNDSLIPADFKVFLRDKTSPWSVSSSLGGVSARKSVEIDVELMMRDSGSHSGKLIIEVLHRPSISVNLTAVGIGSSVILDPVIFPQLDFGILLSHQDNTRVIMIKNEGTKVQKLSFSNLLDAKNVKNPPTSSTFFIEPFTFELSPSAVQEVKVLARSEAPGDVLENWWIHSMTEGQRRREILGESIFSANFVVPAMKINKKLLNFFVNIGPDEESCSERLMNELEVSNTSGLMLSVKISGSGRFRIVDEEEMKVQMMNIVIYDGETRLIGVCFVPEEEENNFLSRVYEGRVKLEYDGGFSGINIKCKASVNYPNVTFATNQLEFDAIFGNNCEKSLIMKNEGSVPVYFTLSWDEKSVNKCLIETARSLKVFEVDYEGNFEENYAEEPKERIEVIEESIDELFRLSKLQGMIPPDSEEIIILNFSAKSPVTLEAQLICEVLRGHNELIKINARTDFVRYNLNREIIDIGYQNIFSDVHEVVILDNSCELNLNYEIDHKEDSDDTKGILEIVPSDGIITRRSKIEFTINYKCLIPGNFEEIFTIQIENSPATNITLQGCAILPQIYLHLPHNWEERNYSLDKEYSALQSLNVSHKIEGDISIELIRDHHRLIEDNWHIIYSNECVPTLLDIDMTIEQFLTTQFIRANWSFLLSTFKFQKLAPIPHLYSAEYILDMNCLITEQLVHHSLIIYNYSPQKMSIRMKPPEKKNYLSRYGIAIKFRDQETLMPREFCKLDISISPPRDLFLEKTQKIKRKIYLEVINGCTVPISIIATVTSPFLKLSTTVLNFGDVIIGNCKVMNLGIQNGGIIDCKWRIKMYSEAKPTDFPFSLSEAGGTYSSGESGVISAYFKPRRGGSYQVEVVFEVNEGRRKSLMLLGRGIEQKLRIIDGNIVFSPGVPGAASEKKEFSVKNLSKSPLEVSWQHLDEVGVMEERIMRVLTHYYGSKEILLPVRELGTSLPKKIYEFYEEIIEEMNSNFGTNFEEKSPDSAFGIEDIKDSIGQIEQLGLTGEEIRRQSSQNDEKKKEKKHSGLEFGKKKKSVPASEILKNESIDHEIKNKVSKIERSREESEDLLHNYIDKLQKDLEFEINMKDPVSEIFAELNSTIENSKDSKVEDGMNISKDKRCFIFYGGPFTKYQETACKAAKILDIPLLNLNSAITELIATGESENSSKSRKVIDEKYQELLVKAQKFIRDDDLTSRRDSTRKSPNFEEIEDYLKGNVNYTFVDAPDPVISFQKIPDSEELETLDLLTQYEYKIEAIHLLENILVNSGGIFVDKGKSRAKPAEKASKNIQIIQEETFAAIDLNLFAEILKEILMKKEFESEFILQTLNNDFIKNDSITFSKILDSILPEFIAFINFHNSLETYQVKVTEKRNQIAKEENDKLLLKLKLMDEMSLSEFEELSEEDKNLFYEKVQRPRIEEARERREKFQEKISKPKTEEEIPKNPKLSSPPSPNDNSKKSSKKTKGTAKGRKSKPSAQNNKIEEKKIGSGRKSSRKGNSVEQPFNDQAIADAMDLYKKNLNTIILMINDKSNTLLAAFTDPWDPTIYDFIINQISQNRPKKEDKSIEIKTAEPEIEEKIYSLYEYNRNKRSFSSVSDEVPFIINEMNGEIMNSRIILGPNEAKHFKVVFNPKKIGEFHHEFALNIIGNNNQVYRINLSGVADIPRLNMNPKLIFTRIKGSKINEIHDPTFFVDTKTFDFGFLLTPEKDKKEMKVHHKISKFNFINSSLINVDAEFSLMNELSETFSLDKTSATVHPEEKIVLKITATALKIGPNTDKLLMVIKNNPQVEEILLKSSGCKLDIEIDGKIINFERILLYRKDCRRVTIKNKTPVRVYWRIMESNEKSGIDSQISFSSSSGVIEPLNETDFDIYFHGQLVGFLDKKQIPVGIFLFENDEESLLIENISISAEVYDVSVDLNDANPIDFKAMKIGEKISQVFSLKNQGLYDINFVIELEQMKNLPGVDKKLFKNFNEHLKINPLAGTLIRDKLTSINLEFTPKTEMKLKDFPILKCNIFDISKNAALIAEIPLTISIIAQYSKFIIEPYPELFCGPIPIYTYKTTSFLIKNTGIFPIDYKISSETFEITETTEIIKILPPKLPKNGVKKKGRRSTVEIATKSSRKSSKPSKEDDDPLKIGSFALNKTQGSINTGEIEEISIVCYPEFEGKLTNNIYVKCSNSPPEDQNGRQLILNLDSCIPKINCDNFTSIFCDSHIVDTINNFSCTFDESHSIFSKEEMTLYFEKVIVSNVHKVGLKLHNPGLVPAEVEMNLGSDDSSIHQRNAETDGEAHVFEIEPRREIIPAMSSRMFAVTFNPASMENYSCILEATVVLSNNLDPQKLSVKLNGEGCIPEITLIEPKTLCKHGNASLEFGKCLLGETQIKKIVFKNNGRVRASVIAEISEDHNSLYYIKVDDDDDDADDSGDREDPTDDLKNNCVEILLNCGEISKILVIFQAKEIGICEALVRVFVSDNPYEVTNIDLRAEGFIEPVVIKGLGLMKGFRDSRIVDEDKSVASSEQNGNNKKKKKTSISKKRKKSSPVVEATVGDASRAVALVYELNVGVCCLEEERISEFEIVNTCEDKCFRFEFDRHEHFVFIPSTSHLHRLESKRIVVKFRAGETVTYEQLCLNCSIDEIQHLKTSGEFVVSWDDQQMRVGVEEIVESNSEAGNYEEEDYVIVREINCPVEEPNYELIHKDSEMIQLVISAVAAWANYHCPAEELNFENTFVFEKRTCTFELTNAGLMNLLYSWRIIDHIYNSINSFEEHSDFENSQNSVNSNEEFNYENRTHNSIANLIIESQSLMASKCFKILPETGVIIPNQTTEFLLTFIPEEEKQYNANLICEISNLDPQISPLKIQISGKALRPHYHFEIPELENDYLKIRKKHDYSPENIKIIEFKVIGVGDNHRKEFNLINPTDELYKFTWKEKTLEMTQNAQDFPYFHCETPEGIAKIGEKNQISFMFFARNVGIFESFWEFSIEEYEIKVPFLLVGVVTEPRVTCCPPRVELRPTVAGDIVEDSVVLTNDEDISFNFSVMKKSLFSVGGLQTLFVEPMTGILIAKSEELLKIKFKPTRVGNFDFPLEIEIEKMREPSQVFVAAQVYEVIPRLIYIDRNHEAIEIRSNCENLIDLGKLMIKKSTTVNFELSNMGELPFHYRWNVRVESSAISKNLYDIKINDSGGEIQSQETIASCLSLMVLKRVDLRNQQLTLKVINGPIFTILLNASAKCPSLEFSFTQYNFGARYIRDSSNPYEVTLQIVNNEETPAIVEVNTENSSNFMINSDSLSEAILAPNAVSVPIYFRPAKEQKYEEYLIFTINSAINKRITLKGEGISYKVNLLKPQDKLIDLGHVPLGKTTKRSISIINSGKTPVKLQVNFIKLPPHESENRESSSIINAVTIHPASLFPLSPHKTQELIIKFKPQRRMNSFEEVIGAHIGSAFLPLSFLRGKCLAPEFHLNQSIIQFDTVTEGFTEEQKIVLHNSGDFTSKFKWNFPKLPNCFSIKPIEGISSPGTDVIFNVKFTSNEKSKRNEGEGIIEIENYKKITVSFIGTSRPLPEALDIINFITPVRKEQQKNIKLENDLNITEKIEISVLGNYFTSDKFMNIPPKSSKSMTIKYLPLIMTHEDHFHEGKIVVKLLEQKAVKIYGLRGFSSPPESLGKIIREVPAKKKHIELFLVENWDNKTQCFMMNIELMSSRGNEIFTFLGNDKIDVNAKGKRSYQAIFHCFNESTLNFQVSFTNPEGEYQFYKVEYKITKPEILKTIELITTAKALRNYFLEIVNPLEDKKVNYSSVKYDKSMDILIEGIPKVLSPNSVDKIVIKYLPIFPGESREVIEVISDELGVFPYELKLKSLPPAAEKIVNVFASLGSSKKFSVSVKNSSRDTAEFFISIEDPFICRKQRISIESGDEESVELIYEPSSVGKVEKNLVVASKTAGEIVYPIVGIASLPKAQGPFTLNRKKPLIVPFKNVFDEAKTFQYVVDPTISFSTSSASNVIDPKQSANVVVSFKASSGFEDDGEKILNPITGKLVIYCTDPELCHLNWIYYLKGVAS